MKPFWERGGEEEQKKNKKKGENCYKDKTGCASSNDISSRRASDQEDMGNY